VLLRFEIQAVGLPPASSQTPHSLEIPRSGAIKESNKSTFIDILRIEFQLLWHLVLVLLLPRGAYGNMSQLRLSRPKRSAPTF